MKNGKGLLTLIAALGAINPGTTAAQEGFSKWYFHDRSDGVEVYYAVRVDREEIRVAWKCVNTTSETKACSVGAGGDKTYLCRRDGVGAGVTSSLGERGIVGAGREYVFPSDFACRGKGANEVQPSARIAIER